jgi:hypothetical protein
MSLTDAIHVLREDPNAAPRKLLRMWYFRNGAEYNRDGIDVFEQDWDNLIILDACRFDAFRQVCEFEGTLRKVESRGSTSAEFVRGNFTGRTVHDTVYVSANGYYDKLRDEIGAELHDSISLYEGEYRDAAGGLTTHPKTVTRHALDANEAYPNKRLIVHYLQPHQPYLGPFAEKHIDQGHGLNIVTTRNRNPDLTDDDIRRAYVENLELVLDEVEELLDAFHGKTVITADHGELLGERLPVFPVKDYDHWYGIHVPELVNVPWFEIEGESRKDVRAEPPAERDAVDIEEVEEHLADLGYRV